MGLHARLGWWTVLIGLAAFVLLAKASTSHAQVDGRDRARELAEKAQDRLLEGDAKGALDLALQAEAAHHAPTILLLVARAHTALGANVAAVKTYDRVIAEPILPNSPPEFAEAQVKASSERAELYRKVGLIEIDWIGDHTDALLTIGGERVEIARGPHAVEPGAPIALTAELPGHESLSESISVAAGQRRVVRIELVPRSDGGFFDDLARTPVPTIVSFSLAGALGVVGAVTGGLALERAGELDARCVQQRCTKIDRSIAEEAGRLADASTATLVAAAVVATFGGFFVIVSDGGARWNGARVVVPLNPFYAGLEVGF